MSKIWMRNTKDVADDLAQKYKAGQFDWIQALVDPTNSKGSFVMSDMRTYGRKTDFGIYFIKLYDKLHYIGETHVTFYNRMYRFFRTLLDKETPEDGPHTAAKVAMEFEDILGPIRLMKHVLPKMWLLENFEFCFINIEDINLDQMAITYDQTLEGPIERIKTQKELLVEIEKELINNLEPFANIQGRVDNYHPKNTRINSVYDIIGTENYVTSHSPL